VDTAIVELDDHLLVDADTPDELREIARGL
jgi:hypothetical protein